MIGLLLVTHGRLADEFLAALEHVVGPQEQIEAVSIDADDDMGQRQQDIIDAVGRVARGEGVVILTDMFGGTPSNLAISVMDTKQEGGPVEVIAGLNLPMLIKLAQARGDMEFPALVEAAQAAGRKYISVASALLGTKQA
ncbi:MAG: PTS sugar transporter subunit IIA [Rhodospirillaceae bacterium]|jgi:PTS system mannose-specific IIA component|nr:PTS sugar transporter subunit IIA [Rhodospirillaceae bacterium]MBT5944133.1 PTS sugar transporter subunit IIA [Rhodospirillaceae bacterium]MBT6404134.1 PTS sugar transporter subunit IIA [Rhodospirillaceae bacterium]MBT6537612.1 PTS sugar transporter subunit IIA [Rhodospirillaceae bacterium]